LITVLVVIQDILPFVIRPHPEKGKTRLKPAFENSHDADILIPHDEGFRPLVCLVSGITLDLDPDGG